MVNSSGLLVFLSFFAVALRSAVGAHHHPLDHAENVTIKWDIMQWNSDGYTATVTIYNNQRFRAIKEYALGWTWGRKEVIYNMVGAQATEQGDCTGLPYPPPHSCVPTPTIIDLPPGAPYSQQVANCCRSGFIAGLNVNPKDSVSSFIITVGRSGNTNTSVIVPTDLTLRSPKPDYECQQLKTTATTTFPSPDGKRRTQPYLTWKATCKFSK